MTNIQSNLTMQQTCLAFKGRSLMTNPEQMKRIESIINSPRLSEARKKTLLKAEAMRTESSFKSLFRNIFANLKLMFTKNK